MLQICNSACLLGELFDLDPKKWRPQSWGLTTQLFISKRAEILKGRVSTPAIVKGFDVLKASLSGLRSGLKGLPFNALSFEAVEKAFHGRIIVAVSRPAHTANHALLS